jgi:hypothetical protein
MKAASLAPPRSWSIEGSLDGARWVEMDRREDNQDLKSAYAVASFKIAKPSRCCYVRLTQIDKNHVGSHCMRLCAFELFGEYVVDAGGGQ